ncbi:hypothetical protein B296_00025274 [Ensete ventricosum]|uniref:Uncharacterized protein n=1 Tax=Ensete ventricosum TaxID=4639 RepID=A0A426XMW8_ENSVE|nr:hypothetical protein B296_00025274 [Ensete ventricosum]
MDVLGQYAIVLEGVCRKLAEGIGSLPGWCKGVRQKKTETHRKIVGGLDDVVGARREFARRFAEGIRKLARNTPGDRRRKVVRLAARYSEGCQNAGVSKQRLYRHTQDFERLSAVEPRRLGD